MLTTSPKMDDRLTRYDIELMCETAIGLNNHWTRTNSTKLADLALRQDSSGGVLKALQAIADWPHTDFKGTQAAIAKAVLEGNFTGSKGYSAPQESCSEVLGKVATDEMAYVDRQIDSMWFWIKRSKVAPDFEVAEWAKHIRNTYLRMARRLNAALASRAEPGAPQESLGMLRARAGLSAHVGYPHDQPAFATPEPSVDYARVQKTSDDVEPAFHWPASAAPEPAAPQEKEPRRTGKAAASDETPVTAAALDVNRLIQRLRNCIRDWHDPKVTTCEDIWHLAREAADTLSTAHAQGLAEGLKRGMYGALAVAQTCASREELPENQLVRDRTRNRICDAIATKIKPRTDERK